MFAVEVLVIVGLALGLVIGIVVKLFGQESDPRLEEVEGLLPGANCGACGFAGCGDFARALVGGDVDPGLCPSSNPDAVSQICGLLGVTAGERNPKVAVVRCGGDAAKAMRAALYNGVNDCKDAMLVAGGAKGCQYGCLGLGTCARACPFGAIEMTDQGLAVVHPDICTGCGKCVGACPRHIIELVPSDAPLHVLCNSPDKGAAKRKVCDVACIACRKCVKAAGDGQMTMDGFLARVNYEDPPSAEICGVCPTHCLQPASPAEVQVPETEPAEEIHEAANV
jgi:electron transport complex protein RnfB